MKKAVYAGSFDPITNGHVWMVEQAVRLFDEVVVAIGENPDKQHTFSLPDRLSVLRISLQSMAHVCVDIWNVPWGESRRREAPRELRSEEVLNWL